MKRTGWIVAALAAMFVVIGQAGGWRAFAERVSNWISGNPAQLANATTANPNARDVGAGFAVQPRAAGAAFPGTALAMNSNAATLINNDPASQLRAAQERFDRANELLENYRKQTLYPFDSRPAREHPDQMYPNQPVIEDRKLKKPGEKASQNIRLKTSQERVHVAGGETVLFSVAAFDENNAALPISFTRAIAYDPPRDGKPSRRNPIVFPINDRGEAGDLSSSDLVYSARLSPNLQGFASYSGLIRIELDLSVNGQAGFLYFDVFYSPDAPAIWTSRAREVVERGSLNFYLPIDVRVAGRYVITGRIDDAKGQPFALVTFNDELAKGAREVKLNLFGKLLVDEKPVFPLALRDVDGFLLIPDADPDRSLLQRLQGRQLVTQTYPLTVFSEAEWDSEERRRYLDEYGKDVESARAHLEHIRRSMKP